MDIVVMSGIFFRSQAKAKKKKISPVGRSRHRLAISLFPVGAR